MPTALYLDYCPHDKIYAEKLETMMDPLKGTIDFLSPKPLSVKEKLFADLVVLLVSAEYFPWARQREVFPPWPAFESRSQRQWLPLSATMHEDSFLKKIQALRCPTKTAIKSLPDGEWDSALRDVALKLKRVCAKIAADGLPAVDITAEVAYILRLDTTAPRRDVNQLYDLLKVLTEDPGLRLVRWSHGSLILHLHGRRSGFDRLVQAIADGSAEQALGVKILDFYRTLDPIYRDPDQITLPKPAAPPDPDIHLEGLDLLVEQQGWVLPPVALPSKQTAQGTYFSRLETEIPHTAHLQIKARLSSRRRRIHNQAVPLMTALPLPPTFGKPLTVPALKGATETHPDTPTDMASLRRLCAALKDHEAFVVLHDTPDLLAALVQTGSDRGVLYVAWEAAAAADFL